MNTLANGKVPIPAPLIQFHLQNTLSPIMGSWQSNNKVPPVLLFTGIEGIGKSSIVYFLSQWLLCEKTGFHQASHEEVSLFHGLSENPSIENPLPCGSCASCQNAVRGSWIDFHEITDEDSPKSEKTSLKIDQFRKLRSSLGFGAYSGAFKIIFVRNAERMTSQAANSLLKTLEEPPPGWIFLLTSNDPSLLLPTLLSRCQAIKLKPLPQNVVLELLKQEGVSSRQEMLEACARQAQGSWSKARALLNEELGDWRENIFNFFLNPAAQIHQLVDWASKDSENLSFVLDQLEFTVNEFLRWSLHPEGSPFCWGIQEKASLLNSCAESTARKMGSKERASRFWIKNAELLFRARKDSFAPLNKKVLIQNVLLPWLEA